MCRVELPPGPDKLYEEATRRYVEMRRRVDRGESSFEHLTTAQQREMNEVIRMWRNAADQGHTDAQCNLGNMYHKGHGVKLDHVVAVRWYRKAAEQGYAGAQFNVGLLYKMGEGVTQNHTEAVRWYRKAAEQGDADAQFKLGTMYDNGEGVKQNHVVAVHWYRKAAEQGYVDAQCSLGQMYDDGDGVKQDSEEAMRWFHRAAKQGNATAKKIVVLLLEKRSVSAGSKLASPSRTCANCGVAETQGSSVALKPCPRCKAVVYCGKVCQAQHWKAGGHRAVCK